VTAEIFIHCDLLVQQFFYLQVNNLKAQTILTTSTHVSDNVTAPVFAISNLENFREGGAMSTHAMKRRWKSYLCFFRFIQTLQGLL
jgi:hypothetical protein